MPITPINVGTSPDNGTGEALRLGGQKINANFAYLKTYADNLIQGLKWKQRVDLATTGNVVLSGEQTIDGTLTNASRVLVKDNNVKSENGLYTTAAGAWTRTADADTGEELVNATVSVTSGTANANTNWTSNAASITLGTTDITFVRFQGSDGVDQGTFDAAIQAINDEIDALTLRVAANETSITNLQNGKVSSVVAGTNITIDNTDPLNPIVSSTASGGTNLWGVDEWVTPSGGASVTSPTATDISDSSLTLNWNNPV